MKQLAFRDAVASVFRARPNEWIPAQSFMACGGSMAWRTRISDCRLELGMEITNRTRKQGRVTISEYKYQPVVLTQPTLFSEVA